MSEKALENEIETYMNDSETIAVSEAVARLERRWFYRFVKRAFDIAFSLGVLAFLLIPGLLLCLAIRIESPGSPIYRQERVGRYGKPLRIFKFRSMVADADDVEIHFDAAQLEEWHKEHKVDNDPRITRVGSFIRKTSLDEIPQFLNVLLGQMSIIGPRPITEEELEWFTESEKKLLLSVPGGITGWWQVSARNEATFESGLRQQLELHYARNAGFATDANVFLKTFGVILKKTGK